MAQAEGHGILVTTHVQSAGHDQTSMPYIDYQTYCTDMLTATIPTPLSIPWLI